MNEVSPVPSASSSAIDEAGTISSSFASEDPATWDDKASEDFAKQYGSKYKTATGAETERRALATLSANAAAPEYMRRNPTVMRRLGDRADVQEELDIGESPFWSRIVDITIRELKKEVGGVVTTGDRFRAYAIADNAVKNFQAHMDEVASEEDDNCKQQEGQPKKKKQKRGVKAGEKGKK